MARLNDIKELKTTPCPLLLFECELESGLKERWSTHTITYGEHIYSARIVRHNVFEMRSYSESGIDSAARISLTLANADSRFSQIERSTGWKGSKLTVRFLFFDLSTGEPASDERVVFRGLGNPPEEITEATLRLSFTNRLSLQRLVLPDVRIQKRCPWIFPSTAEQRLIAVDGAEKSQYSPFYRCGYSAGLPGGVGNLIDGSPYSDCEGSRQHCEARGMFDRDALGNDTRRFGGVEYIPPSIAVRGFGEKSARMSQTLDNEARYDDFVPLIYGTAWYRPPIVFARNDGNLTHLEVLLGSGEIEGVVKVVANDHEIPAGRSGANMTGTGWYNLANQGRRNGAFNLDVVDGAGRPVGDPYGSMAVLSLVVPNRITTGSSLPRVSVLLQGQRLPQYDTTGAYVGSGFTANPAWVLLDVLRRSGWREDEIDVASFGTTAAYCDEWIPAKDAYGNIIHTRRYECNLALTRRRSTAEIVRGIRSGCALLLTYGPTGLLRLTPETSLAHQQPLKPEMSNAAQPLNGGWPAYEFSDGSDGGSGILVNVDGTPSLYLWSRSTADAPNRLSIEFQDAFNEYQQDALSLLDADDVLKTGQEIAANVDALGVPNISQAWRIARLHLDKSLRGNTYIQFETSFRGFGITPGDLVTVTYLKEGFERQPFRVLSVAPGMNYATVVITAQLHDDSWYESDDSPDGGAGPTHTAGTGLPRPLAGTETDADGNSSFGISESSVDNEDGSASVVLSVSYAAPPKPIPSQAPIPLLSLWPIVEDTGGEIPGGQTLYYAIAAEDAAGAESPLSFVVRASIPPETNTNSVRLHGLSFGSNTTAFHVYRGPSVSQLQKVGNCWPLAAEWIDTNYPSDGQIAPDANYDHANFYWRFELVPEHDATINSENTIGNSALRMITGEHAGATVRITRGRGAGQERTVADNSGDTLHVVSQWDIQPDATSRFVVAESTWRFGAESASSPVTLSVPNRQDATIHIAGRSANAQGRECPLELSPVTRWRLGGSAGAMLDSAIPPPPVFALATTGRGRVELTAVGFEGLDNTRGVTSGTLTLFYWNEILNPPTFRLLSDISAEEEYIPCPVSMSVNVQDLLQVGTEVMQVVEVGENSDFLKVLRGSHGSSTISHIAEAAIYPLARKSYIVPFATDFFGSRAAGSFAYDLNLPRVRIAAAELFVTNARGNSEVMRQSYGSFTDAGLRTLSGGQLSLQVDGPLAIESHATPALIVQESTSVCDVFAHVAEAPTEGDVSLTLWQDDEVYCELIIPEGALASSAVSGAALAPLRSGAALRLDITSVPTTAGSLSGRDLTVTVRL
jgi:hypothetical protein